MHILIIILQMKFPRHKTKFVIFSLNRQINVKLIKIGIFNHESSYILG